MNCATCKFWNGPQDRKQSWGSCGKIPHEIDPPIFAGESLLEEGTLAFTSDSEGWSSTLHTQATFGCILYQKVGEIS